MDKEGAGDGLDPVRRRQRLDPKPDPPLLHLSRPSLHIHRPSHRECFPKRLQILRREIIEIGSHHGHFGRVLADGLGDHQAKGVGVVVRIPATSPKAGPDGAPVAGRFESGGEDPQQGGAGRGDRLPLDRPVRGNGEPFEEDGVRTRLTALYHACVRGHGIEVRINAENPAGGKFLPSPGTLSKLVAPNGFGLRFDAGYQTGDTISQYYDNLIGKLIVWGKDRPTAIARTIRALEELVVEGVATTIPADLAILRHPEFQAMEHSTKWVEEKLDLSDIEPPTMPVPADDDTAELVQRTTTVEVNGKRFEVKMWVPDSPVVATAASVKGPKKPPRSSGGSGAAAVGSGNVEVPMQGTIVKVLVEVGQVVEVGQAVVVLEAMKMENQIAADKGGTVKEIKVKAGDTVGAGDVVVVIA